MRQLFDVRPEKRLRLVDAKKHPWFENHKDAIDALYEHVVRRGEVLNPASAKQILRDFELEGFTFGDGKSPVAPEVTVERPKRGGLFLTCESGLSVVAEGTEG